MTDYEILIAEQADSIRVREFSIKILQQKLDIAVEALEKMTKESWTVLRYENLIYIAKEALKKIKETK